MRSFIRLTRVSQLLVSLVGKSLHFLRFLLQLEHFVLRILYSFVRVGIFSFLYRRNFSQSFHFDLVPLAFLFQFLALEMQTVNFLS